MTTYNLKLEDNLGRIIRPIVGNTVKDGSGTWYFITLDSDGKLKVDAVKGPSSSVDNSIARFNGTTGKLIQGYTSGAPTISDTGDMSLAGKAIFGDTSLSAYSATVLQILDETLVTTYNDLLMDTLWLNTIIALATGGLIVPAYVEDDSSIILAAGLNLGGAYGDFNYGEVGRLQSATDPYFAMCGSQQIKFFRSGYATFNCHILVQGQNELRFYEGVNYVGFEAPALSADQIWVLPTADGGANDFLQTDGAGNLTFAAAAGGGDVTAAAVMTDHSIVRGDGGSKGVQDSAVLIDDSDALSGITGMDVTLAADDQLLIDGRTNPSTHSLGDMRWNHTPAAGDIGNRAIYLDIDANSVNDSIGMVIDYMATGYVAGNEGFAHEINIITVDATGGTVAGSHVLKAGTGTLEVQAIRAAPGVIPLHHESGTFGTLEKAWEYEAGPTWTDITTACNSAVTDVEIFSALNDIVYIGDAATFDELNVTLATEASGAGIKPTFEFSVGSGSWTAFTPDDSTNGFRVTGIISWEIDELISWATDTVNGTADKYWIRITRTANSLTTPPIEDTIQVVASTEYGWDEDGAVTVNSLTTGALTATGTTTLATALTGVLRGDSGVVSAQSDLDKRGASIKVFDDATAVTTGDGKFHWFVPELFNGMNLVAVAAAVTTVSSSGTPTVQIHNLTDTSDMLSTVLTIDANEKHSKDAATPAVINAAEDDVVTGDELRIDVDVAGTGTKGLQVDLIFQLP